MKIIDPKISYDPEADVLMVTQPGAGNIDYATEMGNFIVHFTKNDVPVLLEILSASKIFKDNPKQFKEIASIAFA